MPRGDLVALRRFAPDDDFLEADRVRRRLERNDLAEEIVLGAGRQRGVRVGRADHAELERIGAQLRLVGQPALEASRAYSRGSMSGVLGWGPKLPLSQRSKSANSSVGESTGCVSPSPFICVTSYTGSQRIRPSA